MTDTPPQVPLSKLETYGHIPARAGSQTRCPICNDIHTLCGFDEPDARLWFRCVTVSVEAVRDI